MTVGIVSRSSIYLLRYYHKSSILGTLNRYNLYFLMLIFDAANVFLRLAAVNFFLAGVGIIQLGRIAAWKAKVKKESPKEQLVSAKDSVIGVAKDAEHKVEAAVSK